MWSLNVFFNDLAKTSSISISSSIGNYQYKETDSTNSGQSSLKCHVSWVTLCGKLFVVGHELTKSMLCVVCKCLLNYIVRPILCQERNKKEIKPALGVIFQPVIVVLWLSSFIYDIYDIWTETPYASRSTQIYHKIWILNQRKRSWKLLNRINSDLSTFDLCLIRSFSLDQWELSHWLRAKISKLFVFWLAVLRADLVKLILRSLKRRKKHWFRNPQF